MAAPPGTFSAMLARRWDDGRLVCVGIDPDVTRLPDALRGTTSERVEQFCRAVIDATADFASSFKLNSAFFERMGADGARLLEDLVAAVKQTHPECVVIVDAKRGDIENTNRYYAAAVFDTLGADAVTVHPYMGRRSLEPFLERRDKGVIVMGANSTPGAEEIQDLPVGPAGIPLYEYVCRSVAERWNAAGNCSVTAGANDPAKLARIRAAVGEMPILLLGLGAQGGDLDACIRAGAANHSFGLIPNSSRSILFASSGPDFAEAARTAADDFNRRLVDASR